MRHKGAPRRSRARAPAPRGAQRVRPFARGLGRHGLRLLRPHSACRGGRAVGHRLPAAGQVGVVRRARWAHVRAQRLHWSLDADAPRRGDGVAPRGARTRAGRRAAARRASGRRRLCAAGVAGGRLDCAGDGRNPAGGLRLPRVSRGLFPQPLLPARLRLVEPMPARVRRPGGGSRPACSLVAWRRGSSWRRCAAYLSSAWSSARSSSCGWC